MVSNLNQLVRELHRELRFSVDKESGDTVIKVIDSETDEVVRQIPSEELMALRRRLEEAAGVIFQDSA
jgi:flagellar protein FlaG